ncbi:MAG: LuxR C-terminal-related transcriptional regulator [Panacagrimonas sp.]
MPTPSDARKSAGPNPTAAPFEEGRILERQRLLALDQGQPILVAEAPSGYGKTVLARAWFRQAGEAARSVWVSLDAAARDPSVFLQRLAISFGTLDHDAPRGMIDDEADLAELFARLADHFAQESSTLYLVLDDAHHLAGSPSRQYLKRLVLGASRRLRIFLTVQPVALDIGLSELTDGGRVCWIHGHTLALTRSELRDFAKSCGHDCTDQTLDSLMAATGGWPALVQMAMAATPQQGALDLSSIVGHGAIREYIYERFLTRLDHLDQTLLWTLACLGASPIRLLGDLSTQCKDVDQRMPRLYSLGIVQNEEPASEPSVRIHPLIREAVLKVLPMQAVQQRSEVLAAAADWYLRKQRRIDAVRALIEAGTNHLDTARDQLIILGRELIFRSGQHQTLLELAALWEQASGEIDAEIDSVAVWALTFQRRFAMAEARLERSLGDHGAHATSDAAQLQKALIAGLGDDYLRGGRLARQWLEAKPREPSFYTGLALTIYAYSLKCDDRIPEALAVTRQAHVPYTKVGSVYGTVWACLSGALAHVRLGGYRDALAEIEQGLSRCGDTPGFGGQRAMLRALEAFIRYERNELPTVRDLLDASLPLLPDQGMVDSLVLGYCAAARLRASSGDLGAALDILSEAERCGQQRRFRRLISGLQAERALLLARNGAPDQARQIVESLRFQADGDLAYAESERASRLRARLALADGNIALARQIIEPALKQSSAAAKRYKQSELLILLAMTCDAAGDENGAFSAIKQALTIARSENYQRAFIDEGSELQALLQRWIASPKNAAMHKAEVIWANRIVGANAGQSAAGDTQALVEPLNKREQQLLGLLAEGLSNAEIAAQCFITEGTVKWHLHNLYGKLGVRSRTAALRAARSYGLM